jgi:hypothetical protein
MASTASALGIALAQMVVPSSGSTAISTCGPSPTQLLANVEHRAFVHLPFTDHHAAFDVNLGELLAHGIDGGLVGCLLVAAAAEAGGGDGSGLGHARNLQHQNAIEPAGHVMALNVVGHRTPSPWLFPNAVAVLQRLDSYHLGAL